jgi:hypothetical protein
VHSNHMLHVVVGNFCGKWRKSNNRPPGGGVGCPTVREGWEPQARVLLGILLPEAIVEPERSDGLVTHPFAKNAKRVAQTAISQSFVLFAEIRATFPDRARKRLFFGGNIATAANISESGRSVYPRSTPGWWCTMYS